MQNENNYGVLKPICKDIPYKQVIKPIMTFDEVINCRADHLYNPPAPLYNIPPEVDPSKTPVVYLPNFSVLIWGNELINLIDLLIVSNVFVQLPVIPPVEPLPGEQWVMVTYKFNYIPTPTYVVSNYGRMFSYNRYKVLVKGHIRKDGYVDSNLKIRSYDEFGNDNLLHHSYLRHVIIKRSFDYKPGCEDLQVNHEDGDKTDNALENLTWCTAKENSHHAWENGLATAKCAEDSHSATITNKQAEEVAILITQGYEYCEIVEKTGVSITSVRHIARGHTWRNIYEKYNLEAYRKCDPKKTVAELEEICQYFQDHPICNYDRKSDLFIDLVKDVFNREYDYNKDYFPLYYIYTRRSYTEVSDKYYW